MDKRNENRETMAEDVKTILDKNPDQTAKVTALADLITSLNGHLVDLSTYNVTAKGATQGKTDAKCDAEADLIAAVFRTASGLSLLGRKTKNEELIALAHVTPSGLRALREKTLETTAKNVLQAARKNSAALASGYNISAADIAGLEAKITAFNKAMSDVGTGMGTRKSSNKSIKQIIRELMLDLDQIDSAMELLPKDDKAAMDFYAAYFAVRGIRETGIRHKKTPTAAAAEKTK